MLQGYRRQVQETAVPSRRMGLCRWCRLFDVFKGNTQISEGLLLRGGNPFALCRAVESVIAPNNRGPIRDCANQTPPNAFRAPRSSARISAFRLSERGKGSRPSGVLGRPSDSEILALLLWADAHDASGRSPPSACSPPAGPFFHSLRFFLLDGERPMLHSSSSCFRREIARSRLSTTGCRAAKGKKYRY